MTLYENSSKNEDKKKSEDDHSMEDSFKKKNGDSKKLKKQEKEISEYFAEYEKTLKGISVDQCLLKYSEHLKESNISFNEHCFQSEMSLIFIKHTEDYEVVTLFVSFSHFSFEISVVNLSEESFSQTHLQMLGRGAFGKIYQTKINDVSVVIKSQSFSDNFFNEEIQEANKKEVKNTISKAIFEYCLYKLFSVLEIGPKIINIFGFDMLICKNTIEFSMEKCKIGSQKSLESMYSSLDMMHSFGIIHGDIKSDNIMWSPSFEKWVFIDFGLSQVLQEKPGQKTQTKYFGSFQNSSLEMKALFNTTNSEYIDLYYNDLYGIKQVINNQNNYITNENPNEEKFKLTKETEKYYSNFIDNSQICHILYINNYEHFHYFLNQISQSFLPYKPFWNIIKKFYFSIKTTEMIKKLSEQILDHENILNENISLAKNQKEKKIKNKISFEHRFEQKVNEFNGPINDFMLFSIIYYNFDISPYRFCEKESLFKTLTNKFEPSNIQTWKTLIKFLRNPFSNLSEIQTIYKIIIKELKLENNYKIFNKEYLYYFINIEITEFIYEKFYINIYSLNEEYYIYDEVNLQFIEYSNIRIFEFRQFLHIIQKYEQEFPYTQFLSELSRNLGNTEFITHSVTTMEKLKEKYKLKNVPTSMKMFQKFLKHEFSYDSNKEVYNFIDPYSKSFIFHNIICSTYYNPENQQISSTNFNKEIKNLENYEKKYITKCFYNFFNLEKSISIFFKEIFHELITNISEHHLNKIIEKFIQNYSIFITEEQEQYYHILNNLIYFYFLYSKQFTQTHINIIHTKLLSIIHNLLNKHITYIKLFMTICELLTILEISTLHQKSSKLESLFTYFLDKETSPLTISRLLYYQINIYDRLEILPTNEYKQLLKNTINFHFNIKEEKLKIDTIKCIDTIKIFQLYFTIIDLTIENRIAKEKELQSFLSLTYEQSGNYETFPLIMEITALFYCCGTYWEINKYIKIIIQGTNFIPEIKPYSMQKYITAFYSFELLIYLYQTFSNSSFKEHIFLFLIEELKTEQQLFYIHYANLILIIEKIFKLFFNQFLFLNHEEIIWLLKISSQFIKYSHLPFTRSFNAAMNYWFPELAIKSGIQLNARKSNLINTRFIRNSSFLKPKEKIMNNMMCLKTVSDLPLELCEEIKQKYMSKVICLQNTKLSSENFLLGQFQDRFQLYLQSLYERPTPNSEVQIEYPNIIRK